MNEKCLRPLSTVDVYFLLCEMYYIFKVNRKAELKKASHTVADQFVGIGPDVSTRQRAD